MLFYVLVQDRIGIFTISCIGIIACSLQNCGWFNVPRNDGKNCGNLSNHIKPSLYKWFQSGNYLRVTSTNGKHRIAHHQSCNKTTPHQSIIHQLNILNLFKSAYPLKPPEHDLFWKPSISNRGLCSAFGSSRLSAADTSAFRAVCHSKRYARCLHFPVKKRNYPLVN